MFMLSDVLYLPGGVYHVESFLNICIFMILTIIYNQLIES